MPRMTVLNNIKKLRMEKNLSTRELAKLAGLHRMTIERVERGECIPTQISILKISRALNEECNVVFFLDWRKHIV
jgi:transcriptional regulator with XRE-family HTH domain